MPRAFGALNPRYGSITRNNTKHKTSVSASVDFTGRHARLASIQTPSQYDRNDLGIEKYIEAQE